MKEVSKRIPKARMSRVLPLVFAEEQTPRELYMVVVLPRNEVVQTGLKLAEALAFARGYNEAAPAGSQAAIVIERRRWAA